MSQDTVHVTPLTRSGSRDDNTEHAPFPTLTLFTNSEITLPRYKQRTFMGLNRECVYHESDIDSHDALNYR